VSHEPNIQPCGVDGNGHEKRGLSPIVSDCLFVPDCLFPLFVVCVVCPPLFAQCAVWPRLGGRVSFLYFGADISDRD
jgi:hypothetical protein